MLKRILIDLDGVLNNYQKFDANSIPEIKNGAKEFLEKIYNSNQYELVLFTTRNKLLAAKWLLKNDLDKYFTNITDVKIPAFIHLDDRAICFTGDFDKTFNEIEEFQVYWKK